MLKANMPDCCLFQHMDRNMVIFSRTLALLACLALAGCAAFTAVTTVASIGVGTVATAGSLALSGAGAAVKVGSAGLPDRDPPKGEPEE